MTSLSNEFRCRGCRAFISLSRKVRGTGTVGICDDCAKRKQQTEHIPRPVAAVREGYFNGTLPPLPSKVFKGAPGKVMHVVHIKGNGSYHQ